MKAPKITPGKWRYVDLRHQQKGRINIVADYKVGMTAKRFPPEEEANSRIFAAAPTVAEALNAAYEHYMGPQACGDFTCCCNDYAHCGICEIRRDTRTALLAAGYTETA